MSTSANAQIGEARVVEWNCPLSGTEVTQPPPADPSPGALVADGNLVWYVTRLGQPRLVRLMPGYPIDQVDATCNWWDLDLVSVQVGGLRLRPYGPTAFIRTLFNLQRIDSTNNLRTTWTDGLTSFSDVAVQKYGTTTNVFTTGTATINNGVPAVETMTEVLQRMTVSANGTATITRWPVGGGAGSVYLSGVKLHPVKTNVIYYAEPMANNIGELTILKDGSASIRRWNLAEADPFVLEPRQIDVSSGGEVFGVTGSGHTFRLNPTTNEILIGTIPGADLNQPVGVDAAGLIGYTTAGDLSKVGAWFPDGIPAVVKPSELPASPHADAIMATPETIPQLTGSAKPIVKIAPATELESMGGTFFETNIDMGVAQNPADCVPLEPADPSLGLPADTCSPSSQPQGVAADPQGGPGSFYAGIGASILRVAHVDIPVQAAGIVTGGGWITTTATTPSTNPLAPATTTTGKGSFGLVAMRKRLGEPARGHLSYMNHATGGKVISVQLTDLQFAGKKATIGGVCKSDCITFRVDVTDNGQPTTSPADTFEIAKDPVLGLSTTAADSGPLQGGNVKVRQQ